MRGAGFAHLQGCHARWPVKVAAGTSGIPFGIAPTRPLPPLCVSSPREIGAGAKSPARRWRRQLNAAASRSTINASIFLTPVSYLGSRSRGRLQKLCGQRGAGAETRAPQLPLPSCAGNCAATSGALPAAPHGQKTSELTFSLEKRLWPYRKV